MTGYVRKDTTNNIADGNVINASDLDAEFDGVKDAFQASTGHKHDGSTGEGAPITSLGPNQDVTISATLLAPKTTNTVDIGSSALKFKDLFLAGNGSVGGTLAVTGVATLTANPVLSAGTANGVAYLNGSKVVTSGDTLTYGGSGGNLTVGANGTAGNFETGAGGYGLVLSMTNVGPKNAIRSVNNTDKELYINDSAGGFTKVITYIDGSEAMRLTSTGLGIGTSSPSAKLDVVVAPNTTGMILRDSSGGRGLSFATGEADGSTGPTISTYPSTGVPLNIQTTGAGPINFLTSSTTRATLDSAGNLGLGVTPSAWAASQNAFQIGNAGAINSSNSSQVILSANRYYANSGDRYINTAFASLYQQVSGQHQFYTAPSGTAGNAITFTQAMTLTAAGDLGLGTTGPNQLLHIKKDQAAFTWARVDNQSTSASAYSGYMLGANGNSWGMAMGSGAANSNALIFVLDAGGGNAEKMRLDISGNLLGGKTSSGQVLTSGFEYNNTTNTQYLSICNNGGSSNYAFYIANIASGSTALAAFYSGSTLVGSITYNGALTLYNTTSDQRLKENIQDADSASSLIDSLQVRKFDWKKDNTHQRYGFVAQELVTVAPEAVHQPEDADEMMAVDYSKLVPMLVKEIQSLRVRLAALEAK